MKKLTLTLLVVAALAVPATLMTFLSRAQVNDTIPPRPEGPCDIYAAGGAPCAAAHSSKSSAAARAKSLDSRFKVDSLPLLSQEPRVS